MDDTAATQKSISERISEIVPRLSRNQNRFITAMLDMGEMATKGLAAKSIGLRPDTVYRWGPEVDEAILLYRLDALEAVRQIRKQALVKAIMIKLAGLDSADERLRQSVATELLEWEMGKAPQSVELAGADGGPIRTITEVVIGGIAPTGKRSPGTILDEPST